MSGVGAQDSFTCEYGDDVTPNEQADFEAAELWEEDSEICDKIQGQIEKAERTNQWGSLAGAFIEKILAKKNIEMNYKRILAQFRSSVASDSRTLTRTRPALSIKNLEKKMKDFQSLVDASVEDLPKI